MGLNWKSLGSVITQVSLKRRNRTQILTTINTFFNKQNISYNVKSINTLTFEQRWNGWGHSMRRIRHNLTKITKLNFTEIYCIEYIDSFSTQIGDYETSVFSTTKITKHKTNRFNTDFKKPTNLNNYTKFTKKLRISVLSKLLNSLSFNGNQNDTIILIYVTLRWEGNNLCHSQITTLTSDTGINVKISRKVKTMWQPVKSYVFSAKIISDLLKVFSIPMGTVNNRIVIGFQKYPELKIKTWKVVASKTLRQ